MRKRLIPTPIKLIYWAWAMKVGRKGWNGMGGTSFILLIVFFSQKKNVKHTYVFQWFFPTIFNT